MVCDGRCGHEDRRRKRWRCIPGDGSGFHKFAERRQRPVAADQPEHCAACATKLEPWEGQPAPRLYDFTARDVADALVDVVSGMSHRDAAERVRKAAARTLSVDRRKVHDAAGSRLLPAPNRHGQLVPRLGPRHPGPHSARLSASTATWSPTRSGASRRSLYRRINPLVTAQHAPLEPNPTGALEQLLADVTQTLVYRAATMTNRHRADALLLVLAANRNWWANRNAWADLLREWLTEREGVAPGQRPFVDRERQPSLCAKAGAHPGQVLRQRGPQAARGAAQPIDVPGRRRPVDAASAAAPERVPA